MLYSYLLLLFCVTVWGSNFIFGAILVDHFPPMLLAVTRLLFTCCIYAVMAVVTRRFELPKWSDLILLVPIGVAGILTNQMFFYIGLQDANPTTSALLLSLSPIVIGFLAAVFLREKVNIRMICGSLLALSGVFFVVGSGGAFQLARGEWLMFGAMLAFAVSTVLTRKLLERRDAFFVTAYSTAIGTALLIPVALIREPVSAMRAEPWAWGLLIVTALMMQVICGLIWNRQMSRVGAAKASLFLNLQPFVAMVLGYAVLGTAVTVQQGIGSLLIIGGVVFATYRRKREKDRERAHTAESSA